MDLGKLTALQLAEKIKQHQISVLDGVKYVFDQIEAKEDKVHAYLDTYKKEAYARAKKVQKGIEDGTYTGPLADGGSRPGPGACQAGRRADHHAGHRYRGQHAERREKQLPVHRRSLRILCRSTMPRLLTVWNRQVL